MAFVSTKDLANVLGLSRKGLLEKAKAEGWQFKQSSSGFLFLENSLPLNIRRLLFETKTKADLPACIEKQEAANNVYVQVSDKERSLAVFKSNLIYEANRAKSAGIRHEDFINNYNSGAYPEIYSRLGFVNLKTFYRWKAAFKNQGASGLVRQYGLVRVGAGASLKDIERYYLEHFYLQISQPSMAYAFKMMQLNLPDSICSYPTAVRYLNNLPKPLKDYKRLGLTKAESLNQPYIEQDYIRYKSMQKVVSDHHCLDMVIMYKGKLVRPWITVFQDFRSGKIVGWCPSIAPSSLSILAAYYMMVMRYGIPDLCLFDNGADYRSKLLNGYEEWFEVFLPNGLSTEELIHIQGVLPMLGSQVQFTKTYSGQSKGRLERTFSIFADYLAKPSGTYIGHDTTSRPEEVQLYYRAINKQAKRENFPDWDTFVKALDGIVNFINDVLPSDGKGLEGKTRSRAFEENYEAKKIVDDETLILALTRPDKRRVRKSQVEIGKRKYYHQSLFEWNGRDVIVRQWLHRDDEVVVCSPHGQVICRAIADATLEGISLSETIERVGKMRKQNLKQLAEMGTKEVNAAPEYETMIDVAGKMYSQNQSFIDWKDPLEKENEKLPKAAGAENTPVPKISKRKLKNIFNATTEDYV
ncbi:transposase domain-containing protein [Treponema pedis]|uniref:transposase domain-containing protein n=1 Tax=Treponema pedis TaxID=409322 RepID=UPI003D1C9DEB